MICFHVWFYWYGFTGVEWAYFVYSFFWELPIDVIFHIYLSDFFIDILY